MAKTVMKRVYDGVYYIVREEEGKFYFVDRTITRRGKKTLHETEDVSCAYRYIKEDVAKELLRVVKNGEKYTVRKIHTEFIYVMD